MGNQPISPAKNRGTKQCVWFKTWFGIRNVNLLWVKLTSYQARYLLTFASFQLFGLVWSMHLQCQGFSDVFSAGDGLWPRHGPPNPQGSVENLMVNHLSWWWASLPILTDLAPRYANAEKIMFEESTYTSFSPSQIEGHFPPLDLALPSFKLKKKQIEEGRFSRFPLTSWDEALLNFYLTIIIHNKRKHQNSMIMATWYILNIPKQSPLAPVPAVWANTSVSRATTSHDAPWRGCARSATRCPNETPSGDNWIPYYKYNIILLVIVGLPYL